MAFTLFILVTAIGLSFFAYLYYRQSDRSAPARLMLLVSWCAALVTAGMALLYQVADPTGSPRTAVLIVGALSMAVLVLTFFVRIVGKERDA